MIWNKAALRAMQEVTSALGAAGYHTTISRSGNVDGGLIVEARLGGQGPVNIEIVGDPQHDEGAGEVVVIARDSFARFDVIRRQFNPKEWNVDGCRWCGRLNAYGRLFQYGAWHDGGRIEWGPRGFCSANCWRSYTS